ncbi:MAG TPA: Ig-like domain-containing protein, partial [Pyrinomonadaceae bacterium]|nr:Ig-like domain-containing protein [Pyrinomonadaceae bacterium]
MSRTKKLNLRIRSKIHSTRIVSLFAFLGLLAAVVVSVSVESRTGGRSGKAQPSDLSRAAVPTSNADSRSTAARHTLDPGPRLAAAPPPTVTATKTDALFTDLDNDGKADPGDTLKYTVTITATGADATGVQFTDTLDPNTTFVAGTLMTTPLARNDSYSATGNVRISVPAPGVLANDSDPDGVGPAISATPGTFLSTQGGNVILNANGSFTYNPPAGFEGSDSFTYTLNDNDSPNNTDTATVSITVSGMIWFIDNSASCPCDGRLTNPFDSINSFQSVNNGSGNNPAANDNIFIYESGSAYVGSFALLNGQKVIGQDATASLSSITGLTPPPESDPLPVTNSGNGTIVLIQSSGTSISVASGNTLTGFTAGSSVTDISGSGFGTLTISDVTLNGVGQGLDLSNGTLTATFGAISSTNSLTTGISLTGVAGSLTSGSTTVTNATGIGISVDTSSATLNFANTSVQGSGATGVSLTTNNGPITFGSLDIAPAANQKALLATENTQTITSTSGTISNSGATAIDISRTSSTTPLSINLTSVSSTGGTSDGISLQKTSGSFTINGDSSTTVGGNGSGGTIANKSGADGSTSSGIGIYLNNASNVTLRRMTVNGTNQNFGINGVSVTNFTMEYCTVNGTEGTNQAGSGEGGVYFFDLTGSASIFKSVFAGGAFDNFHLENKGTTTLNRIVFDTDTFNDTLNATSASALFMQADCASTLKTTIQNSTFTAARSNNVNISIRGQSNDDLIVANNQFSNSNPNQVSGGSNLSIAAGGPSTGCTSNALSPTLTFNIHNNTFKDALGTAVSISKGGVGAGAFGTSANPGLIDSNVIGISGNSTSSGAGGISAVLVGGGQIVANITNNAIHGAINGINLAANSSVAGGGQGNFKAILQGNSVDTPNVGVGNLTNGLLAQFGAVSTDNPKVCLTLGGAGALKNNFSNAGQNGGADLRLRARFQTIIGVVGYGGANNDDAAMISFLTSQNTIGSGGVIVNNNAATGSGWTGTCPSPGPALAPIDAAQSDVETSSASPASGSDDSDQSDTLRVPKGAKANNANGVKLTQSELNSMVQAAIQRWRESDASAEDLSRLLALTFEVSDLPNGQLASMSGTSVKIDEDAAGYGWFFDTTPSDDNEFAVRVLDKELQTTETSAADGHIDLLTVLMRELGLQINRGKSDLRGPAGWLMEPTLSTGTRRAPAFKMRDVSKANLSAPATRQAQLIRATGDEQRRNQSVAAASTPRSARALRNHATRPATSLADILLNIGTLPAGK